MYKKVINMNVIFEFEVDERRSPLLNQSDLWSILHNCTVEYIEPKDNETRPSLLITEVPSKGDTNT